MQENGIKSGSFILFRLPGETEIYHAEIVRRDKFRDGSSGFVFSLFNDSVDTPTVLILDTISTLTNTELGAIFKALKASNTLIKTTTFDTYSNGFDEIHRAINQNKVAKVVLSRQTFSPETTSSNALNTFNFYLTYFPNALVSFIHFEGESSWCGASPELLYSVEKERASTVALASTRKDNGSNIAPIWNEKEINEQWLVEKFVEQNLENLGIEYQKTEPKAVKSGNLWHLKTTYWFKACDSLASFIGKMHPTPAVGGSPKDEAIKIINMAERHDRKYYTGVIGPYNLIDKTVLFVNIRCIEIFENGSIIYTGGGITADSTLDSEWEETNVKARSLMVD